VTATRTRTGQNGRPDAIETVPTIDELLGVDDKARIDAGKFRMMAQNRRDLKRNMLIEGVAEDEPVPGSPPRKDGAYADEDGTTYRTCAQQLKLIDEAWKRLWDAVERDGYRASVLAILAESH
jgi:hypothetical protein